jgi:hypothetical protein
MAPSATENNFRTNLSQFRWARGVNDDSQQQPSDAGASSRNPFSRFYNAVGGGYVPLRSSERSNEEEAYFALSRWERFGSHLFFFTCSRAQNSCPRRLLGFLACLAGAAVCFGVAFFTLPLLALRPAKFALSFR